MGAMVWLIVGIVLLTITLFVHKHTYWCDLEYKEGKYRSVPIKRMTIPMWAMILLCVVALTPYLNAFSFAAGVIGYVVGVGWRDIVFHWENKAFTSITKFLTKQV